VEENLGDLVDRLVGAGRSAEDHEAAAKAAIEAAKPKAFAAFEAKAVEAAKVLAERQVLPETTKDVVLRYENKKKFLSSQVVRVPVLGPRISGWILHQAKHGSGGSGYYIPPWLAGMMMDEEGHLYSFKSDAAIAITSFDEAVEAIGSTNAYSLDRVDELQGFWEDKVTHATVRAARGDPYASL
jgi:hypothetical protein